ncbi:MAG: tetratricopeptide repeat protein [Candidatus Kariarchaeaceae archaeon]|jgi:non-specific serine/threonine protein kinase/serine/threonine-protein kinase
MSENLNCKNCGMPITEELNNFGTNNDGSRNDKYCSSCYEDGTLKEQSTPESPTKNIKLPEDKIPNCRLLQKIGEGGMGIVYLAEQEKPIRRKVAVKIIKHGMDTKEVIARFESERQALAIMDHPNIAKVFYAGFTENSRPYFAIEYVKGIPISEHCEKHRININQRLKLIIKVCEGVQHAHQKAIIHRDLKPSNVLITIQDDQEIPKIIDFGVAKATAQRLTEQMMYTEIGQIIGTPEYMSPEQAEMTGQDIDTRTDVYSLGVILYKLLAGTLPFDAANLRQVGHYAMKNIIREKIPPKPSTRVSITLKETGNSPESPTQNLPGLAGELKGDLDWITMMAIEKDRTRRYGSANDLADDIKRYLNNEPIEARPPSVSYLLNKFVRRHRGAVPAMLIIVILIIASLITLSIQNNRTKEKRDRANKEAEKSNQVSEFLVNIFQMSDPSEALGNTITARELLDKGAADIDDKLKDQPEIQSELMNTMGKVYQNLGLYDNAGDLIGKSLKMRRGLFGDNNLDVAATLENMAILEWNQGNYDSAETHFKESLDIRLRILGAENLEVATSLNNLGVLYATQGELKKSESFIRESLALRRKLSDSDHPDLAESINNLGNILYNTGNLDEAEPLYRESLELDRKLLGDNHPDLAISLNNLAALLASKEDFEGAESLYKESLEMRRRLLGAKHPGVATVMNNLGSLNIQKGDLNSAEKYYVEALEIRREVLGNEHQYVASTLRGLASVLESMGEYQSAEKMFKESLSIYQKNYGDQHRKTIRVINNLISLYETWGKQTKVSEYRTLLPIEEETI